MVSNYKCRGGCRMEGGRGGRLVRRRVGGNWGGGGAVSSDKLWCRDRLSIAHIQISPD